MVTDVRGPTHDVVLCEFVLSDSKVKYAVLDANEGQFSHIPEMKNATLFVPEVAFSMKGAISVNND